ncbi:MAG: filamentous hemagglutinin N-terminal domain-containing protein, partial [Alphaproteobacteria bacterium]|nr:filamentous hemagglutinin N-terminal domain-containing protein [Alphaproteobacteria bacterium]
MEKRSFLFEIKNYFTFPRQNADMEKRYFLKASSCLSGLGVFILGSIAPVSQAVANPEGGNVVRGDATISAAGNTLNIHQNSQKAVIDWRKFDIKAGETTQFHQPNSSSYTLNRVNANAGASQIDGMLKANGNIAIVNPNGVLFGAGSQVDVNGLVATTAD